MAENILHEHAEAIAAHMTRTGELPVTNQVLEKAAPTPAGPSPTVIASGVYQQKEKGAVQMHFFSYTPTGSNGKPLASRYRITIQDGPNIRRFDLRAVKSDDSEMSDTLEHLLTGV
tara:strand:- start:5798 stop:6145 length:348 start_codon:yes stop_codon:yes gene_type:complete